MSRAKAYVALVTLLVTAGCAAGPEIADEASAEVAVSAADGSGTVVPDTIVDANELVARTPPPVICRHVLKQGSNVIIEQCRTAQDWKLYERRQAQEAAAIVRTLQRGAYR
jgi:hypothetical protein